MVSLILKAKTKLWIQNIYIIAVLVNNSVTLVARVVRPHRFSPSMVMKIYSFVKMNKSQWPMGAYQLEQEL